MHQQPPNSWPTLWACYYPDTLPALLLLVCPLPRSGWPSRTPVATRRCNSNIPLSNANKNVHTVLPFDLWLQQPRTEPSDLSMALTPFPTSVLSVVFQRNSWSIFTEGFCDLLLVSAAVSAVMATQAKPTILLPRGASRDGPPRRRQIHEAEVLCTQTGCSHSLCNNLSMVKHFLLWPAATELCRWWRCSE